MVFMAASPYGAIQRTCESPAIDDPIVSRGREHGCLMRNSLLTFFGADGSVATVRAWRGGCHPRNRVDVPELLVDAIWTPTLRRWS
jgi:hypothetical protein